MSEDDDQPPPDRVPRWLTWGSLAVVALFMFIMEVPWPFVIFALISLILWGIVAPVIYK